MDIFQSVILGAVEGITEFLPISSTAHLIITSKLLGLSQTPFVKSFEIAIQFGAVCAVIFLYAKKVASEPKILSKILAGFIPTAIIGFVLYSFIKSYLFGNFTAIFWALLVGGIILIVVELYEKKKELSGGAVGAVFGRTPEIQHISYLQAASIGTIQALAVIPGVSRSAATIIGGRLLGLSKTAALEFSFLLALPTIAVAALYDVLRNLSAFSSSGNILSLAIGFGVSFITALVAIQFLLAFVRKHSFIPFGIYRIILAFIVLVFFII